MKIKVIKATFNDSVSYLAHTGYNDDFGRTDPKTVDNPLSARNYALPQNEENMKQDMSAFYITGLGGAKSGIRADKIELVEFEVHIKETATEQIR